MIDLVPALKSLRPGAQWTLEGDEVSGLVWNDPVQSRPTDDEIIAEAERIAARPKPYTVAKAAIYERCTDAEAEAIDAAIAAAGAKLRGLWNNSLELRSDSAYWPQIVAMAEGLFGQARAAELLAPQNG